MRRTPAFLLSALLLALVCTALAVRPYVDFLWMDSLGRAPVFWTLLIARTLCFGLGALLGAGSLYASIAYAQKQWPDTGRGGPVRVEVRGTRVIMIERERFPRWGVHVMAGWCALVTGLALAAASTPALLYLKRQPFNLADPLFGLDVSFYVLAVPFWRSLLAGVDTALLLTTLGTLIYYGVRGYRGAAQTGRLPACLPRHAAVLLGIFLILRAPVFLLDRLDLVISAGGAAAGAGYVDATIRSFMLAALAMACLAGGIFFLVYRQYDRLAPFLGVVVGLTVLGLVGLGLAPTMVQAWVVRPNELAVETPYIQHALEMTRKAWGLDSITSVDYPVEGNLTPTAAAANQDTLRNVRLWDPDPLRDAYQQLQSLRTYYRFHDVDIDRYQVEGRLRQVMLSAREVPVEAASGTWVNRVLKYTHGFGLALSPVTEVTAEGQPLLWLSDLPPRGLDELPVERPEIYFGELTDWYVLAGSQEPELDYHPDVTSHYSGQGGFPVGGSLRRLALALYFSDFNILISPAVSAETRILFARDVAARLDRLVPFLAQDPDPYLVVSGGRLYWIVDMYTASGRYPYSQRQQGVNYLRNSVKAVVDAYEGTVRLAVVDPDDPLVKTYQAAFPSLFNSLDDVEPELRRHFRYPEFLMRLQAEVFKTYHVTDPAVFYNDEDPWDLAQETYGGEPRQVEPYYAVMELPGSEEPEFLLMLPFTPRSKENMVAWLAAHCDPGQYGQLVLYRFPKERLIYGPGQVEKRINNDTEISQQITLWNQQGSSVIRGNLLAIPIDNTLLYVEPLYLKAKGEAPIPELKRVIVAGQTGEVAMRSTFEEALAAVLKVAPLKPAAATPEVPTDQPEAATGRRALEHLEKAEKAAGEGRWADFGREMEQARAVLKKLAE